MSKFDKEYLKLCKIILEDGTHTLDRMGIPTIKIPSYTLTFNLEEEFPILTTKQVSIKEAVLEMLWIYQVQSSDVRWLQERGIHSWDMLMIDHDGVYRTYNNDKKDNIDLEKQVLLRNLNNNVMSDFMGDEIYIKGLLKDKEIASATYFGEEFAYTIGTDSGYMVRKMQLTDRLLKTLKNHRYDRGMIMSLWQDEYLKTAVLPSCIWSSEWDVNFNKLNVCVHQRGCDVPFRLPLNITQYAALIHMIAREIGLDVGTMNWSIKDAHIYENQVNGIEEQIKRYETLGDFPAPELWLNPEVKNFYDFDNSKECKDVKLLYYKHHGKINFN